MYNQVYPRVYLSGCTSRCGIPRLSLGCTSRVCYTQVIPRVYLSGVLYPGLYPGVYLSGVLYPGLYLRKGESCCVERPPFFGREGVLLRKEPPSIPPVSLLDTPSVRVTFINFVTLRGDSWALSRGNGHARARCYIPVSLLGNTLRTSFLPFYTFLYFLLKVAFMHV